MYFINNNLVDSNRLSMKTIKIFLASSEELSPEREKMADLVLHLNKLFKGRGLELDLEKWEYLDASMSDKRKQDEYNDVLHQCDICMVLFWRRFGSYTGEELDVAYKSMLNGGNPQKIYVFFKNPSGDDVSQEVRDFIADYERRFGGHFFCKFQNVDTMKLEFLLQLENYQKDMIGEKAIEVRNEHVYVDNEAMVDLNNVPFAAANEKYKETQAKLTKLREEIEKKREELKEKNAALLLAKDQQTKLPNAGFQMFVDMAQKAVNETGDSLQKLLNHKNKLEEEFEHEQQNLFNTARRMSELRGRRITDRIVRAIEAFESGDAHRANIILEEAERDADQALADIRQAKKVGILSIDELLLKTSTIMSDTTITIEERIEQTYQLYQKAVVLAKEVDYDKEKYADLLYQYGSFLQYFAKYDEALSIFGELNIILESILGTGHSKIAWSYNYIGIICEDKGDYDKALEYHMKALVIWEKVFGKENSYTATSYNNIGGVYRNKGNNDKALEYHIKALDIWKNVLGTEHPAIAGSHNNIGLVYHDKGDYDKALEYYMKALNIWEKVLGTEHSDTALCYNNIGNVYYDEGNYDKALKYFLKALEVKEKLLGKKHPSTVELYKTIRKIYLHFAKDYENKGDYDIAIKYHLKALEMNENFHGNKEHLDFIKQCLDSL